MVIRERWEEEEEEKMVDFVCACWGGERGFAYLTRDMRYAQNMRYARNSNMLSLDPFLS